MRTTRYWLAAQLTLLAAGAGLALAPEPEQVADRLRLLCASQSHLLVRQAGSSPRGRAIPLVVASTTPNELAGQLRLLVLARQHGDEPVPAQSALLWLSEQGQQTAAFRRVAVILVPTLNVDGAVRGTRENAAGVDLNRDWVDQSQPETQLALRIAERYQPHAVVDLHTFAGRTHDDGTRADADWVECHRTGSAELDRLSYDLGNDLVGELRGLGENLDLLQSSDATRLAHRYFAERLHMLSWLFEVGDHRTDPEAVLLSRLVTMLSDRYDDLKPRLDAMRGLRTWHQAEPLVAVDAPAAAPLPAAPRPRRPAALLGWYAAGLGLLLAARGRIDAEGDDDVS
ncbi:MAG: DUF2817 domain-containing protein [Armatimonadetes bacterium]|nr:DUF2817 domain-containing protein [Armatimonadota bacterium]